MYFLKDQYAKNLTEVTSAKNADGLSGMDKMEMNLQKIDEGLVILAEVSVKEGIKRIIQDNDFNISEEEIDYYVANHKPTDFQKMFVLDYWSKYLGSTRNVNLIGRRDYVKLMLTLKKKLLLQAGYEQGDKFCETAMLPYLISGNVQDKVNTRIIRNNKYVMKIDDSDIFKFLTEHKYKNLNIIRPDYILSLLSQINNTVFTYVVYEKPELLGKEIEYNEDKVSDELLFFLLQL